MVGALFDTSILIDHLNAVPRAREEIGRFESRAISIVSWMEVTVGAADELVEPTRRFLDGFTVNSDDPACFGGYLVDNFVAVTEALGLGPADLATLARNSIEASFLDESAKEAHLDRLDRASAAKA